MRWLISTLYLVFAMGLTTAQADDRMAIAVEGAYLLIHDNDFQRVLSFTRGGTVSEVGSGEQHNSYTSGLGSWQQTGPNQVVATIVDFNFDRDSGAPTGTARTVYTLTFEGLEQGKFQRFSGRSSGEQFAFGQNPFDPSEPPIRAFGQGFTGQRIPAQ
ncbi:hypothetical protein [Bauldia sp.]|uniref:hypothetical protein n=1 Tax=Bauldia sp. TaxID=2575872 RepID=UPI003BADA10C